MEKKFLNGLFCRRIILTTKANLPGFAGGDKPETYFGIILVLLHSL